MPRIARLAVCATALLGLARLSAAPVVPTSYTHGSSPAGWYPDDGGTQLTDGLYNAVIPGASLGTPDTYNWVGWDRTSPSIVFDFGQVVTITSVSLSTVRWEPAGVSLPSQVQINASPFNVTGAYAVTDKALLTFNGTWTGSTLSLSLTPANQWTFLDEVTFQGYAGTPAPSGVPEGGTTAALLLASLGLCAMLRRRAAE